ncbi:MAG: hypothetical protein KKF50_01340 [Nanoarchaeota archaeon]|nr:hypothetical protein [Nanoarchaeota archaeon]
MEREIMIRKFSKKDQYQSRIQYIVFLVSCLEFFLEEIFKIAIDKNIISLKELRKFKKFKSLKFDLTDLEEINKNKIKLSEILAEEMNFQNIKDIIVLLKSLNLDENYKLIPPKTRNFNLLKIKRGNIPKKKTSQNIEKNVVKFIVDSFGADFALPKEEDEFIKMFNTLKRMILLRHKIIHKAQLIKLENWESWAYSMATAQFGYIVYALYKLKKQNDKPKN